MVLNQPSRRELNALMPLRVTASPRKSLTALAAVSPRRIGQGDLPRLDLRKRWGWGMDWILVGSGGGGGCGLLAGGGGGGGGEVVTGGYLCPGTYGVTVGAAATGGQSGVFQQGIDGMGKNGSDSILFWGVAAVHTARGGGGGLSTSAGGVSALAFPVPNTGGAASSDESYDLYRAPYNFGIKGGNPGGTTGEDSTGTGSRGCGAGGGGSSALAGHSTLNAPNPTPRNGGAGADGVQWVDGNYYGGGGGGGASWAGGGADPGGAGGLGGGAAGASTNGSPSGQGGGSATANTGGGGGGGVYSGSGGSSGTGIFIIRYPGAAWGTGGTIVTAGGYTTHSFTANGTLVLSYPGTWA